MSQNIGVNVRRDVSRGGRNRAALITVSLGVMLVSLDGTSVVTALPNMQADLRLSQFDVGWVLSAFLLTYSSFRLLGGYLSDLYGHRVMFLNGLILFVVACLVGGGATSRGVLFAARAIQGAGGAVIATSALSLMAGLFTEATERARAMSAYALASAGGSSGGLLFGGLLTSALGWRWIFLVNIPLGIAAYLASRSSLREVTRVRGGRHAIDITGSITMTALLTIITYMLLEPGSLGGAASHRYVLIVSAVILLTTFIICESRAHAPVIPLFLFKTSSFIVCSVASILFSAAGTASIFASLYLQLVRHYEPFRAGLAFLPLNLSMALISLRPAEKLVALCGIRWPISGGLLIMAIGFMLLGSASIDGSVGTTILLGLTLLGISSGIVLSPLFVGAMNGVASRDMGVVSGFIGTTSSIGRILGLAVLISVSATRTDQLVAQGEPRVVALNVGYHTAFFIAAGLAMVTAIFCLIMLRRR